LVVKRFHRRFPALLIASTLGVCSLAQAYAPHAPQGKNAKPKPTAARIFTLPDLQGKRRSLAEFKGRLAALFFFCGCEPCHKVADAWGQVQKSGALRPANTREVEPATLLVFLGNADAAKAFMDQVGLDGKQTVVLPDGDLAVARAYNAVACPRVFVVDPQRVVRYTNAHKDDAPQKGAPAVITAKTLAALRAAAAPKNAGKTGRAR
jgi:hypothetical protein